MDGLKNVLLKNEARIYFLVALLHGLYAGLYVFFPYLEWLFNLLSVALSGNYREFQEAFPNHYYWLFIVSVPARIVALSLFLYVVYRVSKRISRNYATREDWPVSIRPLLLRNVRTIAVAFAIYLLLYLLLNLRYEVRSHHYRILQLFAARGFLIQLSVQVLVNVLIHRKLILAYFRKYLFEPALPYNIAILRILFFAYMAMTYVHFYDSSGATLGLTSKIPLPYIGWLVELIPVNTGLYAVFAIAGAVSCIFIIVGFKTRWFLAVNAICCFYVVATPNFFGKLWHHQIIIWISWFFAFARCYDVYSIDSWLRKTPLLQRAEYTFPVRFIWIQFGIIYFWAGFYKLWDSGFDWALSRSMVNQVQLEWLQHYNTVPAFRIDKYPFLLYTGGILVILFELSYVLFVLKKAWRWVAVAGGILMHSLIGYFMYILFFSRLWIFYLCYIDFNMFYKKRKGSVATEKVATYSRKAFYFGAFILSMNFLAGMFNIDSYPFSAYPKYAMLIPGKIKVLRFECGDGRDVHEIARQNHFRWESYGWLEENLIRDFGRGQDVRGRIEHYWEIWTRHNPQLADCDSVRVFIDIRPVSPEGKDSLKTIGYICTFIPGKK